MSKTRHWLTPDWPVPANVHAATTLRSGGVSDEPYASLNPALHVGDEAGRVMQNRQIIREMLDLPDDPVWMEQIHSNRSVKAIKTASPQQADASYTDEAGVVCAVMTADCLPLLVCAQNGSHVAAIHAGWRGLVAGIIGNTLAAMPKQDYWVWLGPAIGPEYFEVGSEVRDAFIQKSAESINAFKRQGNGKWLADIYQLARVELAALGIDNIYGGGFCTVTEQKRFYSYRRDRDTGRMVTLIWKEE